MKGREESLAWLICNLLSNRGLLPAKGAGRITPSQPRRVTKCLSRPANNHSSNRGMLPTKGTRCFTPSQPRRVTKCLSRPADNHSSNRGVPPTKGTRCLKPSQPRRATKCLSRGEHAIIYQIAGCSRRKVLEGLRPVNREGSRSVSLVR